jgi:hypothetical protein
MTSLYNLAQASISADIVTKPLSYYKIYDREIAEENPYPDAILEIGVHKGESTKILAARFPDARIVALDYRLAEIDFSEYPNITYLQCDQTDSTALNAICSKHFAAGIDLVIDDASHIGQFSSITFHTVFPHLKSRALYCVEDWGTGYWPSWTDGGRYRPANSGRAGWRTQKSIPSHDLGMVGFVKSLVDFTAIDDITDTRATSRGILSNLLVFLSRIPLLRGVLKRAPRLKSLCLSVVERAAHKTDTIDKEVAPELPRLTSVKYYSGVCVARKA